MRRGTRIASAYIKATVDGDGINEDIVDSVDEAGPGVERAGKEHGERYGDRFNDGFARRIRGKLGKGLSGRLNRDADKAGNDAGDRLGSALVQSLRARLDSSHDLIARMTSRLTDLTENPRLGGKNRNQTMEALTHGLRSATNEATLLERQLRKVMQAEGLIDAVSRNGRGGGLGGGRDGDLLGSRLFGGSSRNDAIHALRKSLAGITNLFDLARIGATRMFSTFIKGFSEAGEGASFFQRIMGGFAGLGSGAVGGLGSIAAAGPAAAVGILAVASAMAILASVMSALIALMTAMAATLAGAVVAALAVTAGAVGALVVAGGLLTATFMSMTDAQKKLLKDAFVPLREEMVGLGQIMLKDMIPAFSTWSINLQNALMLAEPVAQRMGKAFAEAGNIITASLSGPGFQMLAQQLATWLPSIITNLAHALGGFLNGLAGLFSALLPFVNRFAVYLSQVASRFAQWATSAEGQNSISLFVQRAVASLKSLWNAVSAIGGFIVQVFFSPEAMTAGNSIFDSIANTFRDMTKKIKKAQADGSLKKWFDDAKKFGKNLWSVIVALYKVFTALSNSGVLSAIGKGLSYMASYMRFVSKLVGPLVTFIGWNLTNAFKAFKWVIDLVGGALGWLVGKMGYVVSASSSMLGNVLNAVHAAANAINSMPQAIIPGQHLISKSSLNTVQSSGASAIAQTNIPKPKKAKSFKNPYKAWANSLIKDGPSTQTQMKTAMRELNAAAAAGIKDALKAQGDDDALSVMNDLVKSLTEGGKNVVDTARQALNSAAQSLAGASSMKEARRALKKVNKARQDMQDALDNQQRLKFATNIVNTQKVVRGWNVLELLKGNIRANTTLAEFAQARLLVANRLEAANAKLTDALALRNDYQKSVADSIKAFGELTTAQAQTINGVEQALTATDITSNLQARLTKIQTFQSNLRLLLAQGLSNDAYKQIVDQGVDAGSTFAQALLNGGVGAIQQTNQLVGSINTIADSLGVETSKRLYQAGVDAAQGLVDGLTSLSKQLESAAAQLGAAVANAIKRQLGIKSPSKVMYGLMYDGVGDGMIGGLDAAHAKVGNAASRLAGQVAVSPEVAAYASRQDQTAAVSGNNQKFRDLHVHTPTEDPHAVAMETLNEVTGRLT